MVLADAPEPILIAPVTASSPRLMAPPEELSERAPVAFTSNVEDVSIATAPAESISTPPAPAFKSIVAAFNPTRVDELLPTVMVLADAPEPILIAPVSVSSPILMAPPDELSLTCPVEAKLIEAAPVILVAPVPPKDNVAVPSVNVKASVDVSAILVPASIVTAPVASISIVPALFNTIPVAPASISIAKAFISTFVFVSWPNVNVPVPFGNTFIFALFALVVISITFAEVISMPPATLVKTIESALVPVSLEIFIWLAVFPAPLARIWRIEFPVSSIVKPPPAPIYVEPVVVEVSVVAPVILVAPVPPKDNVAVPSVNVKASVDVNAILVPASIVTWLPALMSRPPAVDVKLIASAAVPDVFNKYIFSFAGVAEGSIWKRQSPSVFASCILFSSAALIRTPPALAAISIPAVLVLSDNILIPPVPASNSISVAFISTLVDASLPTVMVLADDPEPILIAPVTASLPRLMAPEDELSERAPALSISRPLVPSCFIITSSSRPSVILPLSEFNFKSWFILMSPLFPIIILWLPSVKNCNWSLSSLAAVSALIYVSWSTSMTPPKEPQAFPAP